MIEKPLSLSERLRLIDAYTSTSEIDSRVKAAKKLQKENKLEEALSSFDAIAKDSIACGEITGIFKAAQIYYHIVQSSFEKGVEINADLKESLLNSVEKSENDRIYDLAELLITHLNDQELLKKFYISASDFYSRSGEVTHKVKGAVYAQKAGLYRNAFDLYINSDSVEAEELAIRSAIDGKIIEDILNELDSSENKQQTINLTRLAREEYAKREDKEGIEKMLKREFGYYKQSMDEMKGTGEASEEYFQMAIFLTKFSVQNGMEEEARKYGSIALSMLAKGYLGLPSNIADEIIKTPTQLIIPNTPEYASAMRKIIL